MQLIYEGRGSLNRTYQFSFAASDELCLPSKHGGCIAKTGLQNGFIKVRDYCPEVVLVFAAAAKQLGQNDVICIHDKCLKLTERGQRMDSLLPPCWKIMRLKMRQLKAISMIQFCETFMLATDVF